MFKTAKIATGIQNRYRRTRGAVVGFAACSALLAFAVGQSVPVALASPTEGTWTQQISGVTNEAVHLSRTDANHLWASGTYGKTLRTTDGGQNWLATLIDRKSTRLN